MRRRGPVPAAANPQLGVALVTALLVVALASAAAVAMATRLHVDVRRSGNLLHGEQAYAYAVSAESWADVVLRRDARDNGFDGLDEDWATALPAIPVEGGYVNGRVLDLQGRFNVNNLIDQGGNPVTAQLEYFRRLLEILGLDPALATAVLDWIDPDINATFPGGAEDDSYLLAEPPYRAANRQMVSTSELRLVQGFTPEVIAALSQHVTALPETTNINVNTATPEVLLALDPKLDPGALEGLLEVRDQGSFQTVNDFLAQPALTGIAPAIGVDIKSNWFLVLTDVAIGSAGAQLASVLRRDGTKVRVESRVRTTERLLPAPAI